MHVSADRNCTRFGRQVMQRSGAVVVVNVDDGTVDRPCDGRMLGLLSVRITLRITLGNLTREVLFWRVFARDVQVTQPTRYSDLRTPRNVS